MPNSPTLPPQRKGRLQQYNRRTLEELQDKFDELEASGLCAKPEQVNVHVEYLNISFLVKEPNGGSRLVASFGEVAQYTKPQPSLMPNVDSVCSSLSPSKTIVCAKKATVLGWVWSNGTLQASLHKLVALSSVEPPSTVHDLRSFVGAYKVLSRVLPWYTELLDPLDHATAGKESMERLVWSDELIQAFKTAQRDLEGHMTITTPKPSDDLWIVTDGSVIG